MIDCSFSKLVRHHREACASRRPSLHAAAGRSLLSHARTACLRLSVDLNFWRWNDLGLGFTLGVGFV
jgi:hypothetical protein